MIKLVSLIFTHRDESTVTIENQKIFSRITSQPTFTADINIDSKKTAKPLLIKLVSLMVSLT